MSKNIYRYDHGTIIECPIREKGKIVDLSTAESVEVMINSRTMKINKMATFVDKVNGLVEFELTRDDLVDIGGYQMQGIVTFIDGNEFASDIEEFYVKNRLRKS